MAYKRVRTCLFIFLATLFIRPFIFAQEIGFVKFDLNVDSVSIIINNDFNGVRTISTEDSISLGKGLNLVNLSVPFDRFYEVYVQIIPGKTKVVSHEFSEKIPSKYILERNYAAARYYNVNAFIITDSDSKITVGNSTLGVGFAKFTQKIGLYSILIENEDFGTSSINYLNNDRYYITLFEKYTRPEKPTAQFLSIIPGGSQFYKKQIGKSALFFSGTTVFFGVGISANNSYKKELQTFNELKEQYNNTENESLAFELGNQVEKQQKEVRRKDNMRRAFFGLGILSYSLNIFDAFKSTPDGGYRKEQPIEFYLTNNQETLGSASVSMRYNFKN